MADRPSQASRPRRIIDVVRGVLGKGPQFVEPHEQAVVQPETPPVKKTRSRRRGHRARLSAMTRRQRQNRVRSAMAFESRRRNRK